MEIDRIVVVFSLSFFERGSVVPVVVVFRTNRERFALMIFINIHFVSFGMNISSLHCIETEVDPTTLAR